LTWCGERVPLPTPCQRLLALLALHDRPLRRSVVAATLWIEANEERAAGNLRSALWKLRRNGHTLVELVDARISLASGIRVDLNEASAQARRLLGAAGELAEHDLDDALLANDLLPDWYDEWLLIERERFRELRLRALDALCERYAAMGSSSRAVECGLAAIRADPLRESSHRALIRIYLSEGNQAEAVHQYHLYRQLLNGRLGLNPSAQMTALVGTLVPL
jgi:DNA-binding SARP family transcriptional activator